MKIRLMGPPDLVRAWSKEMERAYGVTGAEYPCRRGSDLRCYIDIDDREAERIIKEQARPASKRTTKPRVLKEKKDAITRT